MTRALLIALVAVALFALLGGVGFAAPVPRDAPPAAGLERTFPITKDIGITFCWIPAGECQLGTTKDERAALEESFVRAYVASGQKPQKAVQLVAAIDPADWAQESEAVRGKFATKGFWLGKFQATQEQWMAVTGDDGSAFAFRKGGKRPEMLDGVDTRKLPVESVTWKECVQFAAKLQEIVGREAGVVRLPHENEWEYACRGGKGNKTPFYFGASCNGTEGVCVGMQPFGTPQVGPYHRRPLAVGSHEKVAPHPWGLCDMGFNVREWCANPFAKDSDSKKMATRGGSWTSPAWASRSAARGFANASDKEWDIGLRVVLAPPQQ